MVVCGKHCYVIRDTGRRADVNAFTPEMQANDIRIIDAAVLYECPYSRKEYVLVLMNALHVPAMDNNLLPPFIAREAGITVNDVPKIHVQEPTANNHVIMSQDGELHIPLALWGVFSYFPTSAPSERTVAECDNVVLLTPEGVWNPHSDAYARNEEHMLDWEGNMIEEHHRHKIILDDIPVNEDMALGASISHVESKLIDKLIDANDSSKSTQPNNQDKGDLAEQLEQRAKDGKFMMSIGSTNGYTGTYLFDDDEDTEDETVSDGSSSDEESDVEYAKLQDDDFDVFMASSTHARVKRNVDAEHLSKVWRIDPDMAKRTLDITSQNAVHQSSAGLSRNYPTNDRSLRYKRISEYFFTDTFFATKKVGKSTRGNTCCQLFVTDKGFVYVVPLKLESEVLQAIKQFAKEVGAPEAFIVDSARAQKSKDVRLFCSKIGTALRILEEGTPWANKAELYIGFLKEASRKDMKESDCPLVLWDYCVERRARINNLTARNLFQLHGSNAHTALTGEEADISNLCEYGWYEWGYFREKTAKYPFNKEILGRVLGPARGEGNEMSQWILKANGNVVPRRTVRPLSIAEKHSETEEDKRKLFDQLIKQKWGTSAFPPSKYTPPEDEMDEYRDEDEEPRVIPEHEDVVDATGRLLNQQPNYDKIIGCEVQMQNGDEMCLGKVTQRAIGPDGRSAGSYDDNPILNSIVYEVEFPDGISKEYAANVIADNMISQVDHDGISTTLMQGIVDYRRDDSVAIPKSEKWVTTRTGQRRLRKSTIGWKLLVQWQDGSEIWVPLKDLKESHPVETAEFAKARGIDDEVAFAYWVPYTLRKRDAIIGAVKSRAKKTTHKFGIELPNNVAHAHEIDAKNGNTYWRDALDLEMHNVGIAFEILDEGQLAPSGWKHVTGHIIFDVKMCFTRKARWVLDGHKTRDPDGSTYAGVVSRESVRIALTYAALNQLQVTAADIRNAYLQAPSSQKDYIICGPEFGLENVGRKALVRRALYGGKAAGRDFRNHLAACMRHLEFVSCPADPDVWMRPAVKSNGDEYYEFVLLYTDDVLVVSENGERLLRDKIGKYFELKEASIGPPKQYLGGHLRQVQLVNGVHAWAFSSSKYVQEAVKNVERYLETEGGALPKRAETPIQTSYRPELDVTPELRDTHAAYYQSLVGMLRWMVELGRVDICLETSMMSSHLALPREGHLAQLFHMFAYLKKYHNTEMVFDPSDPVVDPDQFERKDWTSSEFGHVDGKEELPPNAPTPRGLGFTITAKVDADHASDTLTRRSRTGFLVYLNCAPVYWMSKKQTSVESSTFGSEFMAMKHCCEYIRGLRYKLRMMGIPCELPAYIKGDNQSVLANTSIPDSTLKKKSQSIAYHLIREGSARDEWRTTYVNTHDNESDLLTKVLPSGEKRRGFVRKVLHHIFSVCV
jgi:hypothetical protein